MVVHLLVMWRVLALEDSNFLSVVLNENQQSQFGSVIILIHVGFEAGTGDIY